MKVTAIYVYPVKALRGIRLEEARLGPQGVEHDRRFMLCRVRAGGELQTVNLAANPACGLFAQELAGDEIHVRYRPDGDGDEEPLRIPLRPETAALARARVDLHHSLVMAHRMGAPYDGWFSARFGFETALVFIGDGRRPVLGTFAPQEEQEQPEQDGGREDRDEAAWLAFSDVAPFLVTSERSLADVSARLPGPGGMDMRKFRPNVVVDGEAGAPAYDEDFWAELAVGDAPAFRLTKLCCRCGSIDVDYGTGRRAGAADAGAVLRRLMPDRRVDAGWRYGPVFGKYAFLVPDALTLRRGDRVDVSARCAERPVCDWPVRDAAAARFYRYAAS